MNYQIHLAKAEDLERIEEIYAYARSFMAKMGNPTQWGNIYPPRSLLEQDIASQNLYVITDGHQIHGVFAFILGEDPTYQSIYDGAWHQSLPYGTVHRIAGDGAGGILKAAVDYAAQKISYLRIDTHHDNTVMQMAVKKVGFRYCGIIYVEDGTPRIAYDLLLNDIKTADIV